MFPCPWFLLLNLDLCNSPLWIHCRDNELGLEAGSGLGELLAINTLLSCLDMSENPLVGSVGVEGLAKGLQVRTCRGRALTPRA